MKRPLTIFCVCVGERYSTDYVRRLASMFGRHLRRPFHFVCAADKPEELVGSIPSPNGWSFEIETIEPRKNCWGWWQLMTAYGNPGWAHGWQVMYVGLDTVITGDITDVVEERMTANRLTLLRDFSELLPPDQHSVFRGSYADGVAFIPMGGVPALWEEFLIQEPSIANTPYPMHLWMTDVLKGRGIVPDFWQDVAPGLVCSFKWPEPKIIRKPREPIVCFHGEPRPEQALELAPWIGEHWK